MPDIRTSVINLSILILNIYYVLIVYYVALLLFDLSSRYITLIYNYRIYFDSILFSIITIIILFLRLQTNAGIYNGLKNGYIILFVFLFIVILVIKILRVYRLRRRQYIRAIVFTSIIFILFVISISIWFNVYYPLEDHQPSWITKRDSFVYNNQTYNVSTEVITVASTFQGFYVKTPFQLSITEGLIEFHNNMPPNDTKLEIMVKFYPHVAYYDNDTLFQNFLILQTNKKDDYNYTVITPNIGTILYYTYSGQKFISTKLLFNGKEVKEMEKVDVVLIKPNELKAQIDMNRAVIILALWAIFTSLYRPINTFINWLDEALTTKWLNFENEIK